MTRQRARRTGRNSSQARFSRNSERLLDAGVAIFAEEGWAGLEFAGVGRRAGLSRRTLQDRFVNRAAFASAIWTGRCAPALKEEFDALLAAAGLLGQEQADEDRFIQAIERLVEPSPVLLAASELLVLGCFEAEIRRAVSRGLGRRTTALCSPQRGSLTRADAGRRAFVIAFALGLVLGSRSPGGSRIDISAEIPGLWAALRSGASPIRLPTARALHLDGPTVIETGDGLRDALLSATLELVGSLGYGATTVEMVAAAAGCSQGAIFSRYPTKLALFVDATGHQQDAALRANHDYIESMASRHGRGIAEAVTIREFQRPGREHLRAIMLEQLRVMWHEPDLLRAHRREMRAAAGRVLEADPSIDSRRARGHVHFGYALGLGTPVLTVLDPACWTLPFDVVTVPLAAG